MNDVPPPTTSVPYKNCTCGVILTEQIELQEGLCTKCINLMADYLNCPQQEQFEPETQTQDNTILKPETRLESQPPYLIQDQLNPNKFVGLEDKVRLNIKQTAKDSRYDITIRGNTTQEVVDLFVELENFAVTSCNCKKQVVKE